MKMGSTARKTSADRPESGMTLVETVMAIAIFGIFISGAFSAVLQARKMTDKSRAHYQAISICKNRVERANSMSFPDVYYMDENGIIVDESGAPDPEGHFRRSTTISLVSSNLWELTVVTEIRNRETWQFIGGATSPCEVIATYICDYVEP